MSIITIDEVKRYCWYLLGILGVVYFWAGVWDGIGSLPYINNFWASLIVGIIMLTLSEFFFPGINPFWGQKKSVNEVLQKLHHHSQKQEFHIKYHDQLQRKELRFKADRLQDIEKGFLVLFEKGNQERFIPIHRVTEILHKGKTHWKA